jgi:threonine/homoserine/homoserine lactone efflux protein
VISAERFAAFLAAAVVLAAIPGPGMLYVVARTLGGGRREGLISTAGTAIGGSVHVVAAALGLSALLATSAVAFTVVKYVGAAYLVFLGLRLLWQARKRAASVETVELRGVGSGWAALRQGALTEALNPKTALFFLAFVPQFVDPSAGWVILQSVVFGVISVTLNSLADIVAVGLSGVVHRRIARRGSEPEPRWPKVASGSALLALGGYAAVEG